MTKEDWSPTGQGRWGWVREIEGWFGFIPKADGHLHDFISLVSGVWVTRSTYLPMERHKLEVVGLGAMLQGHRSSSSEALLCPGPMLRRPCAHTAGDQGGLGVSASCSLAHESRSLGCVFSRLAEFQREICTLNKNSLHLNAGSGLRRILKLPVFVFQG